MKNKAKALSRYEWFGITVIVTVLTLIVLPSLPPFFVSKVCAYSARRASTAKQLMGTINRAQQAYYLEHDHFMNSRQEVEKELGATVVEKAENLWEISIQTKDDVAFAYAVAKEANQEVYSYAAAATADGKTGIICRTLEPSTAQPTAPMLQDQQFIFWWQDAKLVCSSGTENC